MVFIQIIVIDGGQYKIFLYINLVTSSVTSDTIATKSLYI